MKAILILAYFLNGNAVHSQHIEFPTMAGCHAAAREASKLGKTMYITEVRAFCVEKR